MLNVNTLIAKLKGLREVKCEIAMCEGGKYAGIDNVEEENNKMKQRLTDVYSKILFEFADEIEMLAKKVEGLKEIEKLKD